MNNLNSVLIEGTIIGEAKFETETMCRFPMVTNRYHNDNGRIELEATPITIEANKKIAEYCKNHMHNGRGVRVVGRLKEISIYDGEHKIVFGKIIIEAEHIEFRPEPKEQ